MAPVTAPTEQRGGNGRAAGPNRAIAMLIAAAIGAIAFTMVAGVFVYLNTQQLTNAASWVQHTQEVLNALQRATLLVERSEYRTRLYVLTGDDDQIDRARNSVNLLSTSAAHLKALVVDNPDQTQSADELASCAADLASTLGKFTRQTQLPELQVQRCQKIIGLMTDREQLLLSERTRHSQIRLTTSIITEIILIALSIVVLLVLFSLLLRDAYLRRRIEKKTRRINQNLGRTVRALENQAQESELLTAARDELQLCVDLQQVYQSATSSLAKLLPGTCGSLCIIDNSRNTVEVMASWGVTNVEEFSPPESCCGLRSGQPRWRRPGQSEIHCTHFIDGATPDRYLCHPIAAKGDTLGMLYVQCSDDAAIDLVNDRVNALRQFMQITGMSIAALNLQMKLENQSIRDALTGLFNRHFMQLSMDRELARAARRKQVMAVLMLDMDHFKKFNDSYGHAAGDAALKALAEIFRTNIRAEDIACRYGGEEFAIILPDTGVDGACDRAESILKGVANVKVTHGSEMLGGFTISIGMAFFPGDGDTADLLLQRADAALYRAKKMGRNRLCLFETAFAEK